MSTPKLYWVCVAYLIVLVSASDYSLIVYPPPTVFPYNAIVALIAGLYTLAAIALIFRRRITVPIFLAAFLTGAIGEAWAIWNTGMGPGVSSPEWLALHAIPILIVVAITYYCYRLTRCGFLR